MASKANLMIDMMFHTADQTHLWHLQTKSYALHMALGQYYDMIRESVDRLAEALMGYTGERVNAVGKMPLQPLAGNDQVSKHVMMVCKYCNDLYSELKGKQGAEHILAIIDDVKEGIAKTKYLLTLS
jgi:DNA-binding ferritin-like protein